MTTQLAKPKRKESLLRYIFHRKALYLMILPGLIYFTMFRLAPMLGNVMAFQNFNFSKGILGSPWVGFSNFTYLFSSGKFVQVLWNSIWISLLKLCWGFPVPVMLALLMNEVRLHRTKRAIQTAVYLPHFISWPILGGIVVAFLSPQSGIISHIVRLMGGEPALYMASTRHFRTILVATDIWKEAGWGTIVYMATLSSIDVGLYEAARVDGAGRLRSLWHITLPHLRGTIVLLLILRTGSILENGFDQIFILYSSSVYSVADVLETYIYRIGLINAKYGLSTAGGLFQSVVGFIMILITNSIAKGMGESGIF